jgi:hypothetical protein
VPEPSEPLASYFHSKLAPLKQPSPRRASQLPSKYAQLPSYILL